MQFSESSSPSVFSPLLRRKVSLEIVSQITRAIAERNLLPGCRLPPEPELMAAFGVGRGSIREAVKILEFAGLVEIRRGDGTYVQNSCGLRLLIPLYFSLLWAQVTERDLHDYLSALDYARLAFAPSDPPGAPAYDTAADTVLRLLEDTADADSVARALAEERGQWSTVYGNLPLELLYSFSHYLFRRILVPLDISTLMPDTRAMLSEACRLRRAATKNPSPELLERCLAAPGSSLCDRLPMALSQRDNMVPFRNPKKREGSYVIFWNIIEDIVSGVYAPGDKIPTELEAAEQYEVSRNVVREATKGMEAIGLLELRPGGTFLAQQNFGLPDTFDPRAYGNIIESQDAGVFLTFKAAVRCALLRLAHRNATAEERQEYQELTDAFAEALLAVPQDAAAAYRALVAANDCLDRICRNDLLYRVSKITTQVSAASRTTFVERALAMDKQEETAHAYRLDAAILSGDSAADIPAVCRERLALWKLVEGVED